MGLDIETLRLSIIVGTCSVVALYIYRIACAVNLMRSTSPKVDGINRLIYAGMIVFIPLGIGAWIYDFVVNEKKISPLFLFPFAIFLTTFLYGMSLTLP